MDPEARLQQVGAVTQVEIPPQEPPEPPDNPGWCAESPAADGASGGEAQRICLARAMIRKPEVLLLDEATNALDSDSELHVRRALDALRENCSVVVIAHRLESVKHADEIVVLDEGRIVETGTLESLLQANGTFARMYRSRNYPG